MRPTGTPANAIHSLWLEYNTSTDAFVRGTDRDLVSYVRNIVVLRDAAGGILSLALAGLGVVTLLLGRLGVSLVAVRVLRRSSLPVSTAAVPVPLNVRIIK